MDDRDEDDDGQLWEAKVWLESKMRVETDPAKLRRMYEELRDIESRLGGYDEGCFRDYGYKR